MAGERTVYVHVGAKVDGAVAGLRKVQTSVNSLAKTDVGKPAKGLAQVGDSAAKASPGIDKASKSVKAFGSVADSAGKAAPSVDKATESVKRARKAAEETVPPTEKVAASFADLTKVDLKTPAEAFESMANTAAIGSAVVAGGIGLSISAFADFDAQMSEVTAALPDAGAQMESLRGLAMKLGADTQFSATEAAQGVTELAKAGVSAQEILNGGLKGALDLAAAGQIGVAEAAETTASALNQFGQDGSQATHVADLLSNAANAAQGGVGDMGQALAQAGVAAHAAGLNIDETTTLLALFAKAGMIGSDAGTSLKTMMQRLSAPTEKAAGTMEELGISAYDAQGKFVGAEALLGQLSAATKDLSTEARMAAFNTIFGTDAIRAASIAAAAGADGYKTMNAEVMKVGGAADTAAKKTDNLKGDIERLGGSIDTLFIQAGSSANSGLRDLTQGLGGVVDVVGRLPGPMLLATAGIAGLALAVPKGILAYKSLTGALSAVGLSMDKITTKAPKAAAALRIMGGAAVVAGVAAIAVAIQEAGAASEVATVNVDKLTASIDGLTQQGQLQGGIADLFRDEGGWAKSREEFVSTSEAIERFNQTAFDALSDGNLAKLIRAGQPGQEAKLDKYVTQIDAALAQMVASGNADKAKASLDALIAGIDDPQVAEAARAKFTEYADAVKNVGTASTEAAPQIGETSQAVKDVEKNADDAKKALDKLTETLEGFGSPLAAQRAAQRDYADSVNGAKDAIKKQREELIKQREDEIKGSGGGGPTQASLDAVEKAKLRVAQAQEKVNAVEAKGTAAQKLSARQSLDRANQSLSQARGRANTSTSKSKELTDADRAAAEKWADAKLKQTNLLDQNTDAGRTNQANLDGIRDKTLKAASSTFELTHSSQLAADEVAKGRKAFVQQAIDLGLNATLANELADNMGLVPKDVKATIELSGVPTANTQLDGITGKLTTLDKTTAKPAVKPFVNTAAADAAEARIDKLARQRDAFIQVKVDYVSTGKGPEAGNVNPLLVVKKATGGPIAGPGTGTSDSIPALLSNGEHVLTAAEVAAAGGHGAIYALRKAILTGGVQFRAAGGPVATSLSAYRSAPSSRSGMSIDYDRLSAAVAARGGDHVELHAHSLDIGDGLRRASRDYFWERDHRR